jgi:phage gpG-like protein
MRILLTVDGAAQASTALREAGTRLDQPARPLLEVLAQEMQTMFQAHIQNAVGPDGPWPELATATHNIRHYYGWGAVGPKGIRAGDLLHSLQPLAIGDSYAETGSRLSYAETMNEGGDVTDEHGRTRTVQAFPFVWLGEQEISDLMTLVSEYYFGGERAAA